MSKTESPREKSGAIPKQPGIPSAAGPPKRRMLRTRDAPLPLRLLIEVYGFSLALFLWFVTGFLWLFARIRVHGKENVPEEGPVIFCWWHEALALGNGCFFPSFARRLTGRPTGWMLHPGWIFHGFYIYMRLMGVREMASGTQGQTGREAADRLVALLRAGGSVILIPDGPVPGPPRKLKKGVLHMALQSGAPIVPVRFSVSGFFRFRGWDRKFFPLPFCRLEAHIGRPHAVNETNFQMAERAVAEALG